MKVFPSDWSKRSKPRCIHHAMAHLVCVQWTTAITGYTGHAWYVAHWSHNRWMNLQGASLFQNTVRVKHEVTHCTPLFVRPPPDIEEWGRVK